MKRAAIYLRVSTLDQHPETQGIEVRQFARQRGYDVVQEYVDHGVSGTKVRRPALDQMLKDAHKRKFGSVLVWSCDRQARSTKHFLQVLDELNELGIQFHFQRESIDTEAPDGRTFLVSIKGLISERRFARFLGWANSPYRKERGVLVKSFLPAGQIRSSILTRLH